MKKFLTLFILMVSTIFLLGSETYAYSAGTGYYGTDMTGYTLVDTNCIPDPGTRIPFYIGGTDTYTYYTYYVYNKLRIVTNSLMDNNFKAVSNNEVIGSYENVLVHIQNEYTISGTIGYGPIERSGIGVTFINHQSWDYTYSEGEQVVFQVENPTSYAGIALIQIQMKLVERIVIVEKKYGGFSGTVLISTTVSSPVFNDQEFIIDYDLVPVFYNQLSYSEKTNFELVGSSYNLKFVNSYTPNFSYEYYSMIPSDIRSTYYY
jgi:hypothetical protein